MAIPPGMQTVRVPKGTSAYQAAWIVEDALSGEDSDFTDIEDDDDDVMDMGRANDDARSYAGSGVCIDLRRGIYMHGHGYKIHGFCGNRLLDGSERG
jgi:pre-rRNA-processing protein TSR1